MSDNNNLPDLPDLELDEEIPADNQKNKKKIMFIGVAMVVILAAVAAGGYFYVDHQKQVKRQKAAAAAAAMEMANQASEPAIDPMMESSAPLASPLDSSAPANELKAEASGPLDAPLLQHPDESKIINTKNVTADKKPLDNMLEKKPIEENIIDSVKNDKKNDTILVVKKKVHKKHTVKKYVPKSTAVKAQPKQDIERQIDPDEERFDRIF